MKLLNKILIILFLLLIISGISSYFYVRSQLFVPLSNEEIEKVFEIEEGQGVVDIIEALQKEGLVKNKWVTLGYLKVKNMDKNLKAGTFLIKKNIKPVEVLEALTSSKTALKKITIMEG